MTDREARRRLHQRLIIDEKKPCSKCGSLLDLEIHRIIPGWQDGKYTRKNATVLCETDHRAHHNQGKFKLGNKVIINGRCPQWLVNQLRHNRLRTITSVFYSKEHQANLYYLGSNKMGAGDFISSYPFRSYMLHAPTGQGVGRPRIKRRKLNCTVPQYAVKLSDKTDKAIVRDAQNLDFNLVALAP